MTIVRLQPGSLPLSAAFCPGTAVQGPGRLIFVGGQNGIDARGVVVGEDLASQTKQALRNVLAVLAEAGASQKDVAKLTICLVSGHDPRDAYAASGEVWGAFPTAVTVLIVAGLANPAFLVEIEAVAHVGDAA
jgi:2-iminobutanoate/2-iminopropanoate deaminase